MKSMAFAAFDAARTALPLFDVVTVNRNKISFRKLLLIPLMLLMALCMFAGNTSANGDLTWPVKVDLQVPDDDKYAPWHDVGDVFIKNDHDKFLSIEIIPNEGMKLLNVAIHVVDDPADFVEILDKKGQKPNIPNLDFRTDYEKDPQDHHLQVIALDDLEDEHFCWGVKPDKCPPPFIIVHAELQLPNGKTLDGAYAKNEGMFDRFLATEALPDGLGDPKFWGYVNYPLAKHEAGHFIDANVMGLEYVTITESGTTGEEGQFWFLPDERIAFNVGRLYLGETLGARRISPADLFEESDMDDEHVINMAWLLQSLDSDKAPGQGSININEEVVACLESVLPDPAPQPEQLFYDQAAVGALIADTQAACLPSLELTAITWEEAWENLNTGQKAGNLLRKNISKTPDMKSDKAKIEIMPVYVPSMRSDDSPTEVVYFDEYDEIIEARDVAKPIVVSYLDEVEDTGSFDVFVAVSRDDGDTWKRRNISKTAKKSSMETLVADASIVDYPGKSQKPMLKVKDNKIFVAWTDKYCRGGRPGYAINLCDDPETALVETPDSGCAVYCTGNPDEVDQQCLPDYPGDDAYWKDDLFGVGGPQRSVIYEDYPEMGEVPYSCVWAARGIVATQQDVNEGTGDYVGDIVWFKPEKLTSGRRDAFQLFAGAGTDVAFAIVWQEDPKGLLPGDGEGPGDGWSGANTNNKTDVWYSYITLSDFAKIDKAYPSGDRGEQDEDMVADPELAGRVKALVPMSLPVRISDNEVCSAENMDPDGGNGEHDFDGEGLGTHRYCGTVEGIGTDESFGSNPLCAYTLEKANPKGEIHNVCVTADGRFLDGNTGSSRPNIFLQPYCKKKDPNDSEICLTKSAWVIIGYEESKGVGSPPDGEHDDDGCGGGDDYMPEWPVVASEEPDEDRYKPDMGKNVIYHSFDLHNPVTVASGGMINQPEIKLDDFGNPILDGSGNPIPVYLTEDPALYDGDPPLLLDWKGEPIPATHNARRVRFITQPKSKAGSTNTVLVALYREGEEGRGKPADVFMRRMVAPSKGNPYAYENFTPGARNLSSVEPVVTFQDPFDAEKPIKMIRWAWDEANLNDSSARNPFSDARAHRGALNGDDLLIGYTWTPNWGRKANDKYDFYIRRSFNGGQHWTTDPADPDPIEHNVVFRVPIEAVDDEGNPTIIWDEEVVTTEYIPGAIEPPRNVSNLRNYRTTVEEPRLVKTPGTIKNADGTATGYPEDKWDSSVYQLAYGLDFNQNTLPEGVEYPKLPLDIFYSRTKDKGQRYQSVIVTPQGGSGKPEEGWNPLANDKPQQGAAQLRTTPDGSRMYGIWLEEGDKGSDILFRRVDYRNAPE